MTHIYCICLLLVCVCSQKAGQGENIYILWHPCKYLVLCLPCYRKLFVCQNYSNCFFFKLQQNFVAPEVILLRGHDRCADNWSLGVLIYELIDGDNPFWDDGMDNETLFDAICNSPYFPLSEDKVSLKARHLIYRLLEKNPSKRLGSFREKDILEHPWFRGIDMEKLREKGYPNPNPLVDGNKIFGPSS